MKHCRRKRAGGFLDNMTRAYALTYGPHVKGVTFGPQVRAAGRRRRGAGKHRHTRGGRRRGSGWF